MPGDLNRDGRVDGLDIAIVVGQLFDPVALEVSADINTDGAISSADVGAVTRRIH